MIDKNEILESGMLERYLLGDLSMPEEQQIDRFLLENKDLQALFSEMEADLERMAIENAVEPPKVVKAKLMKEVTSTSVPVIPITSVKRNDPWLAVAASVALLFGITSYWLYNEVNRLEENIQLVQEQNSELNTTLNDLVTNYDEVNQWYEAINDPNAIKLVLKGNQNLPNAMAVGYVNHANKSVVLDTKGLPGLNDDEDYQLWADVEGEMISMGVISKNTEMIAMNYIANAESLNITIEPAGGNDHPTVERLISHVFL